MDWSHLAYKLPSRTRYLGTARRDGKTKKNT